MLLIMLIIMLVMVLQIMLIIKLLLIILLIIIIILLMLLILLLINKLWFAGLATHVSTGGTRASAVPARSDDFDAERLDPRGVGDG